MSLNKTMSNEECILASNKRMIDGLYGFAIGDALGLPIEFDNRSKLESVVLSNKVNDGIHLVPEGTWGDDTSMVLATLDSIAEAYDIDYDNMMGKFYDFLLNSKYTAMDTILDIGIVTKNAILRYGNGFKPLMCGINGRSACGNGALMRMLPIAYFLYLNDYNFFEKVEIVNNVSSLTHAHEISCLGCEIFIEYVNLLLDGVNKLDALNKLNEMHYNDYYTLESINEYSRILSGNIVNLSKENIKSSGYIVDTLEASLWCLLNTDNYESAVLTAINFDGNTDDIGALTGALSGVVYGRDDIPAKWLSKLQRKDYIEEISNKFFASLKDDVINNLKKN